MGAPIGFLDMFLTIDLLLLLDFAFLALSLLFSIASIFIDDLFVFSSLLSFSIYFSLTKYLPILSARLLKESMLPAIAPLA
ncbi:MAG TPA: hypothetical protein VNL13_03415 [Sulfolobales archaeon]|jgi:hypothetical protein|nr:hypothetical protein [Sulfolobales archaeon]